MKPRWILVFAAVSAVWVATGGVAHARDCKMQNGQPDPEGTVCRLSTGECDLTEVCDGVSTKCPRDSHVANGTACDDLSACTEGDSCSAGECGGSAVGCGDRNPCTDDSCDPASGCVNTNNSIPCDDEDACTANDVCSDGSCSPGAPCDDGNPCNGVETCDSESGCVPGVAPADCCSSDADCADECQDGETCDVATGQCQPGTTVSCDDGNPCTTDSCNPASGCAHSNNTDSCDDNDSCTVSDTCSNGTCAGTLMALDPMNIDSVLCNVGLGGM